MADSVEFLPWLWSDEQLRPSLVVSGGQVYFTDSSDAPLKKVSIDGGPVTPLAGRMGVPRRLAVDTERIVWTVDDMLVETSKAQGATTVLAQGNLDATPDLLVDTSGAYWVRTVSTLSCSPPCLRQIELVGNSGPVTLAEAARPIAAIAQDAINIYWEENSPEPVSAGCNCGSTVRSVPKSGGAQTVLVDGTLNGLLPAPPPGLLAGTWFPVGGIATDGSYVYFADVQIDCYRILRVPMRGGNVKVLSQIARANQYDTSAAPKKLAVDDSNVYWIDSTTLESMPRAGGAPTPLASNLESPVDLVLAEQSAFVVERAAAWAAGRVRQVPCSGGTASVAVTGLDWPTAFGLDASAFFWTEWWRLASMPRAGGAPATLASGIQSPVPRIVVLTDNVLVADGPLVKRVPTAGGTVEKLLVLVNGDPGDWPIGSPPPRIGDFVTDGQNLYLAGGAVVQKIPLDGSAAVSFIGAGLGSQKDCLDRVAVDAVHVYWSSASSSLPLGCAINRAPIAGGNAETLVDDLPLSDFVLNGTDIYFTGWRLTFVDGSGEHFVGSDSINEVSAAGGLVTTWPQPGYPLQISADDRWVYWLDALGVVDWAEKNGVYGGSVSVGPVDESPLYVDEMAVDGTSVYWTNVLQGTISKLTIH